MLFSNHNVFLYWSVVVLYPIFVHPNTVHSILYFPILLKTLWYTIPTNISPCEGSHMTSPGPSDVYLLPPGPSNAPVIGRDISPDILATGLPFSVFPQTVKTSQSDGRGLVLRSSEEKVVGIGNLAIYGFLINRDELMALLDATSSDLRDYDSDTITSHYQCNTTKWSFSVVAPNNTVRYAAIQAVISRYLKLAPVTPVEEFSNVLWARAGALFRANIPVANIIITPLPTTDSTNNPACPIANTTTYHNLSNAEPTEIYIITPYESTCSFQVIDQFAALYPFSNAAHLKRDGFDAQVFAHAAQTIYGISIRLWRDPRGIPVMMNQFACLAVLGIALNSLLPNELERNFTMDTRYLSQIDSGVHDLGEMQVRFIMRISPPDARGHLLALPPSAWRDLVALLRDPLEAIRDKYYTWAIEGEIFENDTVIGHWRLHAVCY